MKPNKSASPAQISDEEFVKQKYPRSYYVRNALAGKGYFITTPPGPSAGGRLSEYCESVSAAWADARSTLEPVEAPKEEKVDIYEVYCSHARGMGWDFLVCKTMAEVIHAIESSIDMLEENEAEGIQVFFKKYTAEQMSEVVYE